MNATIHIRRSDEEKWRAIENKSEFIHNALNPDIPKHTQEMIDQGYSREAVQEAMKNGLPTELEWDAQHPEAAPFYTKPPKTPKDLESDPIVTAQKAFDKEVKAGRMCPHGADPRFCKHAKMVKGKKICK
jgi:hypothetical protein